MKIALIGHGKMGKAIERLASERNHEIVATIDSPNFSSSQIKSADVAIEFTQPDAAFNNIKTCLENNIPVLSGTTGWLDKMDVIKEFCNKQKGTFFYASNYSIGVNLFFKINDIVAEIMNKYEQYDPSIEEIHHIHKKDSPSGTAISLANIILKHFNKKTRWQESEEKNEGVLQIQSKREGEIPGTHSIEYQSEMDSIKLTHTAHTRDSFALGVVLVAEWLKDKKGVLSMNDFIEL